MKTTTPRKIIQLARIRTDQTYSQHTTDAECVLLINEAYKDLYNLMAGLNESLFIQEATLTLTDGSAPLPSDMQKLMSVFHPSGEHDYILQARSHQDRGTYPTEWNVIGTYHLRNNSIYVYPTSVQTPLMVRYLPGPVEVNSLDQEISLMGNEDTYLTATLCRDLALREESDAGKWEQQMSMALGNIRAFLAPRDAGSNPTVRDTTDNSFGGRWPRNGWRRY